MKLYYGATSPFVRKVMVLLHEKQLVGAVHIVPAAITPVTPNAELMRFNPLGKIPALVLDDGTVLFDSPVICEYLDALKDAPVLFPTASAERWRALTLNALADGLIDAATAVRIEGTRPEDKRWPEWSKGQMKKIEGVLDQLEAEAKSLKGKLTLGTISVICALGYLDFRFGTYDWRWRCPKLAKWFGTVSKIPSVKATVPPPA